MPTNCSPSEGRRAQRWETIHIGFLNIRLNMPQKLRYIIAWVIRTIKINEFGRDLKLTPLLVDVAWKEK